MKNISFLAIVLLMTFATSKAENVEVKSPDGRLAVAIDNDGGTAHYAVSYDGLAVVAKSRLGLTADYADFTRDLTWQGVEMSDVDTTYQMRNTKQSEKHYVAKQCDVVLATPKGMRIKVTFRVSNNDVAFRYTLLPDKKSHPRGALISSESTSFSFPDGTTTFICPQSSAMIGWEKTKPSYEEEYKPDDAMNVKSQYGEGYTFPCLFHIGGANAVKGQKKQAENEAWVLISETGVDSRYCASHLSDWSETTGYSIVFPNKDEWRGAGTTGTGLNVPGSTPWRTITVGKTLKPIVETTIAYDVVDELYVPSQTYKPGRYTWSWLIWQDNSINWDDQVEFIDLAAELGLEYCLVDGFWDANIGHDRMKQLSDYAKSKGVKLLLWYNSNGRWNDAPQGPRDRMAISYLRDKEMRWMKEIGVAGIKVDFFGSDKPEALKLYEDILFDANRYGIQVIFHGCTLPRGWEKMYPNFVASEAALASENVYFSKHHAQQEGFELCTYAFTRNAVAAFDWGGIMLNRYMSRNNAKRHQRFTSDVFELASGIVIQTSVNCVAVTPNIMDELPQFEKDFIRQMPTTWDETRFIDGYPGEYVVIARRKGDHWWIGGLNGSEAARTLTLQLPAEMAGKKVTCLLDKKMKKGDLTPPAEQKEITISAKGTIKVTMQARGGVVIR